MQFVSREQFLQEEAELLGSIGSPLGHSSGDLDECFEDSQALDCDYASDSQVQESRSIFSASGNHFIFDDLNPAPSEGLRSRLASPPPRRRLASPPPQSDPTSKRGRPDVDAFIDSFRQEGKVLSSAVVTLESMLKVYPELVYLVHQPSGDVEVHFRREELIRTLRRDEARFPTLVFTSFERGLKHAGMEVTQSTHGQTCIKKWAMKKGFVPKSQHGKRARKRKDTGDDDYCEKRSKKKKGVFSRNAPQINDDSNARINVNASLAATGPLEPSIAGDDLDNQNQDSGPRRMSLDFDDSVHM